MLSRKVLSAAILASIVIAAGCGGGGGSSSPPVATTTQISGTASAPGGAVALFEPKSTFEIALNFIIRPVAAAITGLQPVTGATVELIRIDNTGAQVGAVLATTTTSITGGYTLTLPVGTNLAGDLIVRITGNGGISMRAQVVDQSINITPVSEYVLESFINNAADLSALNTTGVVHLIGQVEDFNLAAGSDMTTMLANLDTETGSFVNSEIGNIIAAPGDGSTLNGNYHVVNMGMSLHDDDNQYGVGTYEASDWNAACSFTDAGSGTINFLFTNQVGHYSNLTFFSLIPTLTYYTESTTGSNSVAVQYGSNSVITMAAPFEESIVGSFGWRSPAHQERYLKAKNSSVFVGVNESASVRYKVVNGAVDPAQREGDEVFRDLAVVSKKPTTATVSNMTGSFGRIYQSVTRRTTSSTVAELYTESNVLTFNGTAAVNIGTASGHGLSSTNGTPAYAASSPAGATGVSYSLGADGALTISGTSGFTNDAFDLLVSGQSSAIDDTNLQDDIYSQDNYELTLAVKLPTSQLSIANRTYRVFLVTSMFGSNGGMEINTLRDATIVVNTLGTGATFTGSASHISKASPTSEVVAGANAFTLSPTISLNASGVMNVTVNDGGGDVVLDGFMNHDGSLGVLQYRYTPTGLTTNELGVVVLVEI